MLVLAILTSATLLALSALHVYWGLGGRWGADVAVPNIPGSTRALFRPSTPMTLLVAGALAVAAILVARNFVWPSGLVKLGTWGLAAVFLLRGIGEFRYVGLFKRARNTQFARYDTALFTPLCLGLALACGWIALELKMQNLTPSLSRLDLGIANAYLIRGKNANVLVDAGIQRSLPQIERSLKRAKLVWRDLTHIFITHAHPDHVGNFPEIARLSGAEVWAHRLEHPILRGEKPVVLPDPKSVRAVDRWMESSIISLIHETQITGEVKGILEPDQPLSQIIPDLRVVHLPGHSAGQIGFYHQGEGWLIGADVMMNLAGLTFPMAAFTADAQQAWRSILSVARIQPKILVLGHGGPIFSPEKSLRSLRTRATQHLNGL